MFTPSTSKSATSLSLFEVKKKTWNILVFSWQTTLTSFEHVDTFDGVNLTCVHLRRNVNSMLFVQELRLKGEKIERNGKRTRARASNCVLWELSKK